MSTSTRTSETAPIAAAVHDRPDETPPPRRRRRPPPALGALLVVSLLLSVTWAGYGVALIVEGMRRRYAPIRFLWRNGPVSGLALVGVEDRRL